MKRSEREIIESLGAAGLTVALGDALDASQLIRLANACSLSYPGMRTRSQKRERILSDLVDKASRDDFTRKTVIRALRKATSAAMREWAALPADERARRLRDGEILDGRAKPGVGVFVLADAASEPVADEALKRLLALTTARPEPEGGKPGVEPIRASLQAEGSTEQEPGRGGRSEGHESPRHDRGYRIRHHQVKAGGSI